VNISVLSRLGLGLVLALHLFGEFSLTAGAAPVSITTVAPLFNASVGVAYSQPFAATGGNPPYSWSISSGNTGDLTLDASTGTLHGTPQTAGTLNFTVKVTDTQGASASASYSVQVNPPLLTIAVAAPLPSGMLGTPYQQTLPLLATGGTPPYRWSLASGPASIPGLNFDPASLVLSGTPASAGVLTLTIQVTDAKQQTATKSLSLTILPPSLSISTARNLPDGSLNVDYATTLIALGGTPPYIWSATGLPEGLSINGSGIVSGIPTTAGAFGVAITVADAALVHFSDRFTLNISLPAPPAASITGIPDTVSAAEQYPIAISFASTFPAAITGQAILTFVPETGPADQTVQFASGGTTANFSIPAGATAATSAVPIAIQTGTTAGTISVSLRLQAGGVDITPAVAPAISAQVPHAAPVIRSVDITRGGGTLGVIVSGYATSRDIVQATFTFSAVNGQTLQNSASSIAVSVETLFSNWFQNPANSPYGTQFVLTQPFSVQGDPTAVIPQSVTLTNRVGSTTFTIH
jgi:hypothetical protein